MSELTSEHATGNVTTPSEQAANQEHTPQYFTQVVLSGRLVPTRKILSHGLIDCLAVFQFMFTVFCSFILSTAAETAHYFLFSTFTFEPGHFLLLLQTKVEFVLSTFVESSKNALELDTSSSKAFSHFS